MRWKSFKMWVAPTPTLLSLLLLVASSHCHNSNWQRNVQFICKTGDNCNSNNFSTNYNNNNPSYRNNNNYNNRNPRGGNNNNVNSESNSPKGKSPVFVRPQNTINIYNNENNENVQNNVNSFQNENKAGNKFSQSGWNSESNFRRQGQIEFASESNSEDGRLSREPPPQTNDHDSNNYKNYANYKSNSGNIHNIKNVHSDWGSELNSSGSEFHKSIQQWGNEQVIKSGEGTTQPDYNNGIENVVDYSYSNIESISLEPHYPDIPDPQAKEEELDIHTQQFNKFIDHGVPEAELSVETNGAKLAYLFVGLWYLFLTLLIQGNFLLSDSAKCGGSPADEFPLRHIHARPHELPSPPHGDGKLQKMMYEMFLSSADSSDESDSGEMPDLSRISSMCSKNAFFYGMNTRHMEAIAMVKEIFMNERGPVEMMNMAKALRHSSHMNPKVWYNALMQAAHERSDMGSLSMPGPLDAMPDNFIPASRLDRALRSFRSGPKARSHKKKDKGCIRVDGGVGRDNGLENVLWYFREDLMVNSHHWYWHNSYPLMSKTFMDRRGELFYFAHRSMIQRYNIERLANGLELVKGLDVTPGSPLPLGYNSHLTDMNSGQDWTPRPPGIELTDILHEENPEMRQVILLKDWLGSRKRIQRTIDSGYFLTGRSAGTKLAIPRREGIDILGNTLEATDLSINPSYYSSDGFHNTGHRIIGYAVDPHYHLRLPPGPMGDPATAMRDPIFYLWHVNINNIFEGYKNTLPPYQPLGGDWPLLWKGVSVNNVRVISRGGKENHLRTFWGRRKFDLSLGLAFSQNGTDDDEDKPEFLPVCTTHLDHEEFEYEIHLERGACAVSRSETATVRVFIAPKFNSKGRPFTMEEQRNLFTHLDLFTVPLGVGRTVVTRSSLDSTLTIPWTKSLQQLQNEVGTAPGPPNCGCGWPHHLLLPKGTAHGMAFDLFVMVTNGDEDVVLEKEEASPFASSCSSSLIYCGLQNRKYPDARPMGYPFDRPLYKLPHECLGKGHLHIWSKICSWLSWDWRPPTHLQEYMRGISNMGSTQIVITHKG